MSEENKNIEIETAEEVAASEFPRTKTELSFIEKAGDFVQGKAKVILIVVGVIVVAVAGYFGYQKLVVEPANVVSAESLYGAEAALVDTQDWNTVIKGDTVGGTFVGMEALAKKHAGYAGGNIATYDLGIAYLNNGQPQEALNALKNVDFDDENLATLALGAMGDASMDLGKIAEAASYYDQAYQRRPKNEMTAPLYMFKGANANELLKKYDVAKKLYIDLIQNFPNSQFKAKAEKNLVFVEAGTSVYDLK